MTNYIEYFEEQGVHIFIWKSAKRQAVDAWLEWMSLIRKRDNKLGYILIDFSEIDLPPVRYFSNQVRSWLQKNPGVNGGSTLAIVYPASNIPFLVVARSYSVTLGRGRDVKIDFFPSYDSEAAFNWLVHERKMNAASGS